jgi:UTP-glucose-1-phosphate uridylyltransferase
VAGISFLWASNLERALRERDRAEEVVRLERDLAEKSEQMIQQKEQLEHSIDVIIQTQATVANGNLNARVPLTADNVLWSVAGTLNNLIARLQRARATEVELKQTRTSAAQLAAIIRTRKHGQPAPNYIYNGTMIDTIAMEIFPPQEAQEAYRDQAFYTRDTPPAHEAFSNLREWKTSEV